MGRRFLIAGSEPRVGKTTIGCALGFAMRARRMRVGVMKPLDVPESGDADALALAVGSIFPADVIRPCTPQNANLERIAECFDRIAAGNDSMLLESFGTIESPVTRDADFADLATMLDLEVIVVVGIRSGCAELLSRALDRCASRNLKVAGYILCDCDPSPPDDSESVLERVANVAYLGRMRHREPLARAIVEKLL